MFTHRTVIRLLACVALFPVLLFSVACRAEDARPKAAVEAKAKYDAALAEATKKLQEARSSIEEEQAVRFAAAQTTFNAAAMNAKRDYIAALKRIERAEGDANRESSRALVAADLKFLTEGAPHNEFQKLWIKVNDAETKKDYDTAIEAIREMVGKNESAANSYVLLRLARIYTKQKNYKLAIASYRRAADAATESAMPLYGLIACYLATDRSDEAIAAAKDVLLLNPIDYYANKTLADQYYKQQDYKRAQSYYQTLSAAYPEDVEASNGVAWSYVGLNAHALAKPIFVAVLAVSPDNELAIAGYNACVAAEKDSATSAKPSP